LKAAKLILAASPPPAVVSGDGDEGGGAVFESRRERREDVGVRESGDRESGDGRRFAGGVSGRDDDGVDVDDVRLGDTLERGERVLRLIGERLDRLVNLLVLLGDVLGPMDEDGGSTLFRIE
jgi:hypothetical protein